MVHVRPAEAGDADALAPRLRAADRREIEAAVGMGPGPVLHHGVRASDPCYAVVEDGEVLALFGAIPSARSPETGVVWLLASDDFAVHASAIVRSSKAWIAKLHERYRVLANYVDARNEVHVRWLRWCGFAFVRRIERFGVMGLPFYEVRRERPPSMPGAGSAGPSGAPRPAEPRHARQAVGRGSGRQCDGGHGPELVEAQREARSAGAEAGPSGGER